jgi:hypothetical protein
MVGTLRATEVIDDLHFLEVIAVHMGFECL